MKKLMKMIHFCLLVTNGDFDSVDFLIQKKLFNNFEKRLAIQSTINNNSELNNAKNLKTILIVEVIPNGRKYEIPVKIEIKEVNMEPCVSQQIRLLASKSFIQFGVCNTGDYLCQDLILMDSHDFDLRFYS